MINLQFQYRPLFTIKVKHNYYPEDILDDFYLVPTRRTVQLIDKMAMMVKSNGGEIQVLYDASRLELLRQRLMNSNDSESKFSFLLYTKNPYFVNITNVPVDLSGKAFYLSNKSAGTSSEGKLQAEEYVSAKDLYNLYPSELENNEEGKVNYKIVLENGESQGEMPVMQVQNGYQVDAKSLLEGHYRILGNDKELSSFINIGARMKGSPVGFADIFLNKDLKKEIIESIEENEVKEYKYSVDFDSRAIYWKYLVVPTYAKRLKNINVTCQKNSNKITFKKLGEEVINERKALSFISEEPVKFSKFYEYEIQLKKQEGESGGKTLIKRMAYAPFDLIKPMEKDNYMSEIYVYI